MDEAEYEDHPNENDLYFLKSIVALFFSFARMAEVAARRSLPVRCFILWLFRRAEIIGHKCITGMPVPDWPAGLRRNSPEELRLMAKRLRKLARQGRHFLKTLRRFERWSNPLPVEPSAIRAARADLAALAEQLLSCRFVHAVTPRTPVERAAWLALRFDTF